MRRTRKRVLQRHRRRVRVRERLVRLGHEQREERDDRREPAGDDRGGKRGRVAEVAREHQHRAEREQPRIRDEVAEARAGERAAPRRREARVVGGVRHPRDRDADDDVGALPHGESTLARRVPERAEVGAVERPPREVEQSASGTAQIAKRLMNRLTKPIGPSSARASAHAPKTIVHSHCARNPKSSSDSAAAAVAMTRSSKTVQPRPLQDVDRRRQERPALSERRAHRASCRARVRLRRSDPPSRA